LGQVVAPREQGPGAEGRAQPRVLASLTL
jgi:hypothetical protein